jgi:hypothetical protein
MKRRSLFLLALGLLLIGLPVLAQTSAHYDLSWHVIAGGGGEMASGGHTLTGTLGQPMSGLALSSGHELCSGFWCQGAGVYRIYLPFVLRNG